VHRTHHEALSEKDLAPLEHFVDGAYISAALLATSRTSTVITLRAPRAGPRLQAHTDGRNDLQQFTVDGSSGRRAVPKARSRPCGREYGDQGGQPYTLVASALQDCRPCHAGPSAPGPRTPGAVFISRRRSTVKRCKRREPVCQ